jgi:hypothetical protein
MMAWCMYGFIVDVLNGKVPEHQHKSSSQTGVTLALNHCEGLKSSVFYVIIILPFGE